ncbi:Putative transposase (identified by ISEscan HMM) [Klebsiella pneumoniae]|nr:Putative transposase (identified by ISEscan HMM) [Klebsiella pneumoniae]
MNPFKGRHFQRDIIRWAVRWYCKYGISYRELQEMLAERGVNVDHSTIYRWVQRYAPEMENGWYWRNPSDLARGTWMKLREGQWPLGVSAGPSTAGAALSIFISPPVVTAKLHTGFWVKSSTTKKWQIRDSSTRIKRPPMVARLLCSNAKAGARLTLNTDRLSTGTT